MIRRRLDDTPVPVPAYLPPWKRYEMRARFLAAELGDPTSNMVRRIRWAEAMYVAELRFGVGS